MKKTAFILLYIVGICTLVNAQDNSRFHWFKEARLGIFIHWGIYAVNGIDESWSFYNEYLPYEDYMKQEEGFTAASYDPEYWAELIRESGARYAVLTSKHHDGVALWDTRQGNLSVVQQTPAGRDLIGPFCQALRSKGIKVGLYYSLLDWSHPDYPGFTKSVQRYTEDTTRWNRFMEFNKGQINEIIVQFNPDLIWFDGDWEQSAEKWDAPGIRKMILERNPSLIINSRLAGYGDYATPEQGIPVTKPKEEYWELCMTMNDSWGYQPNDKNYKPLYLVIRIFADVIGMGGNLLLDIGPRADGTIPEEQVAMLKGLGRWTHKHSEAIYGTHAGLPKDCFYGPSTVSADSTILYLFQPSFSPLVLPSGTPTNSPSCSPSVLLKGVANKIAAVWVVGNGTKLEERTWLKPWWSGNPGLVEIGIPVEALDEEMTVVAVQLEGKLQVKF